MLHLPRFDRPLAALRCDTLCSSGFTEHDMLAHNGQEKMTRKKACTQTDPPKSSTGQCLISTVALLVMREVRRHVKLADFVMTGG